MNCLYQTKRISKLKEKMLSSKRYASIEQARIITRVYQENEKLSIAKKRVPCFPSISISSLSFNIAPTAPWQA